MRLIPLTSTFLLLALIAPRPAAAAAASHSVHALLVMGSKERGPSDPKVAPHEASLKHVLHYESFRLMGEGSASVSAGGTATITLPAGNRIELIGDQAGAVRVRRGGRDTEVLPGSPVVVLGSGGDQYAIIVTMGR